MKKLILAVLFCAFSCAFWGAGQPPLFADGRYRMEIISVDMIIDLEINGTDWTYLIDGEEVTDQVMIDYGTNTLVFPSMSDFASVFLFARTEKGIDLFFSESSIFQMLDFGVIFGGSGVENSVTEDARAIFEEKITEALVSMPVLRLIKLSD